MSKRDSPALRTALYQAASKSARAHLRGRKTDDDALFIARTVRDADFIPLAGLGNPTRCNPYRQDAYATLGLSTRTPGFRLLTPEF